MEASAEIKNMMLRVYEALGRGNYGFFEEVISKDGAMVGIGTDPKEWWSGGKEFGRALKAQLEETGGFPMSPGSPQAYIEGTVGWVADQPKLKLPDGKEIPARMTVIFHKEGNSWKIVQLHVSVGVTNEELFGQTLSI